MAIQMKPEKSLPKMVNQLNKAMAISAGSNFKDKRDESASAIADQELLTFNNIETKLKEMKDVLPKLKPWERTLTDHFTALERQIAKFALVPRTQDFDPKSHLDLIARTIGRLEDSMGPIKVMPETDEQPESLKFKPKGAAPPRKFAREWSELRVTEERLWTLLNGDLRRSYDELESIELKLCLLCFVIFPESSYIKKRPLIYWWIGEGLIRATGDKTAEEVGEEIFLKLVERGLIYPSNSEEEEEKRKKEEEEDYRSSLILERVHSRSINGCTMNPWLRRMLISVAREANFFNLDFAGTPSNNSIDYRRAFMVFGNQNDFSGSIQKNQNQSDSAVREENLLSIFNVNEQYVEVGTEWLSRLKMLTVLQLGRWQFSTDHHIEVEDEDFLKGLGSQKHLKYLSLRGMSRITEIPASVVGLISLEILDLRACFNLEKLPSDIGALRRLTHLDVSECYLLESMPKGIDKLSSLQVLKGFVMGKAEKTPCKISDLANLKKLRRLSIHIGRTAVIQEDEFAKLKDIESLHCLGISWGVNPEKWNQDNMKSLRFPPNLEKLDLRGIPEANKPEWLNPGGLKNLKKLYIRGGEFCNWDDKTTSTDKWKVEILVLKYLKNLKKEQLEKLVKDFDQLSHWEVICDEIGKNDYNIVRKGDPKAKPL